MNNPRKRKRPFGSSSVELSAYRDQHFKVCVYDICVHVYCYTVDCIKMYLECK